MAKRVKKHNPTRRIGVILRETKAIIYHGDTEDTEKVFFIKYFQCFLSVLRVSVVRYFCNHWHDLDNMTPVRKAGQIVILLSNQG
jgi:hypothetical protein